MPVRDPAPELDRRHRLDPDRDHMRESWLWIVPLPARGLAVVLYTWVDARGRAGSSALVFGPRLPAAVCERVDDVEVPPRWTSTAGRWVHCPSSRSHRTGRR
jgi:hypothetical protein